MGLSPRVRGNPGGNIAAQVAGGSIPARAGEPPRRTAPPSPRWVYPRACGGTRRRRRFRTWTSGLSPRVRGNREYRCTVDCRPGSIPARAGEPHFLRTRVGNVGVYPRACGEPGRWRTVASTTMVYPRACGGENGAPAAHTPRSIPARAGEPRPYVPQLQQIGVYPRACGGTGTSGTALDRLMGLSPRVRGNRPLSVVNGPP